MMVIVVVGQILVSANSQVARVMPVLGSYLSRYVGSTLFQYLFFLLFKPLLTFLFVEGPEWRKPHNSACKQCFGLVLIYTLQIVFVILLAAVSYSTLLLFTQYRCSV